MKDRIWVVFLALLLIHMGASAYGLHMMYQSQLEIIRSLHRMEAEMATTNKNLSETKDVIGGLARSGFLQRMNQ
ncbi:MAG: hypothetical protein HUU60_10130 [Armatimonadetes bacterium]|nr:hypothetical protein [Armatimonadota bacterium]